MLRIEIQGWMMKILMTSAALLVMFGAASAGSGQSAGPRFSLTISLPESEVKSGSNVEVDITKKNISDQDLGITMVVGTAETAYNIVVTNPAGKEPLETSYGRKLHGKERYRDHHSEIIGSLKPGQTLQEHFFVNQIYDLSQPGKYTIQVSQTVYANEADAKPGAKTEIKSNTVTVTITN